MPKKISKSHRIRSQDLARAKGCPREIARLHLKALQSGDPQSEAAQSTFPEACRAMADLVAKAPALIDGTGVVKGPDDSGLPPGKDPAR
ncbi:MAG: hypothetical protein LBG06_05680 [Deltaproteobacteria bacterium]|jgi:hypothetical protein|nr:hypothetical protein [Deltaproteobacteria bacterium]